MCTPQEARTLHQQLTSTRTALKQADVRIAILEERILALQQVGLGPASFEHHGAAGASPPPTHSPHILHTQSACGTGWMRMQKQYYRNSCWLCKPTGLYANTTTAMTWLLCFCCAVLRCAALRCAALRCAVLQENDMLQKQNELLRSSEAAYQREAQLVSELTCDTGAPVPN
jgi:hypothetical protein